MEPKKFIDMEYAGRVESNQCMKQLELFLEQERFRTGKNDQRTNIINQATNRTYMIPTAAPVPADDNDPDTLQSPDSKSSESPVQELMRLLEDCRREGQVMHISEKQYYKIGEGPDAEFVNRSGIDLDFDIYQADSVRKIEDTTYQTLVQEICRAVCSTLDPLSVSGPGIVSTGNRVKMDFHVAILRKPNVVENTHKTYGKCYKESFRIRIPGIKITKEHKKYIIQEILESEILGTCFDGVNILNPWDNVLDPGSASHPIMMLGSAKKCSRVAHEFYKLYKVTYITPGTIIINPAKDLDPEYGPVRKVPSVLDKRRKVEKQTVSYKYNLVYELSIVYDDPVGLIKKQCFDPKPELVTDIRTTSERSESGIIKPSDLDEIRNDVADLAVLNHDANYLKAILDILSPRRVETYDSWRSIIFILADASPKYKPLAILFSTRCPEKWADNGAQSLDSLWEHAINNPWTGEDEGRRTVATIYAWAKEDNPEEYQRLQKMNVKIQLQDKMFKNAGRLNETHVAEILKLMWDKAFVCDENPYSTARNSDKRWYEFVFPESDVGMVKRSIYKWRREKSPDTLSLYISKKLPEFIDTILQWITTKADEAETEELQKYYQKMKKNVADLKFRLGEEPFINRILKRCEVEFRRRGFEELLDTNPNVIGVENGVLKLYESIEFISRFHEIPITRSISCDYQPYDPNNPHVQILEREIRRLFAGQDDAFEKVMCYLASSLDGRKRRPIFFIWLGEGQNGKTFLLELHINTLREVVKGGYGAKLNIAFFLENRRGFGNSGGPDSEKMMLKFARFGYCSESEPGDIIKISKVKEITSETITGNEKHQTQDMFEANCNFTCCTNNDPRITGRDWGTWRRIWVYRYKMTFKSDPDPNNPYEYKENVAFSETYTKNQEYKKAYFSILVKYYGIFRSKYQGDLENIKSRSISDDTKAYRNEQDTLMRYISEQVMFIGDKVDSTTGERPSTPLTELAKRYIEWHVAKIDSNPPQKNEVIKGFQQSSLRKHLVKRFTDLFLIHHRILNVGQYNEDETTEIVDDLDPGVGDIPEAPELIPEDTLQDIIDDLDAL